MTTTSSVLIGHERQGEVFDRAAQRKNLPLIPHFLLDAILPYSHDCGFWRGSFCGQIG
ncbi:hypothetical protein [Neogemmobacter tilapiae]|uniref:hypothetical protein n=1 Tax=Neogemmobacter tilapiae TaxID=875041 RepID=UPI00167B0F76|nr:hypothetical protein [Gemmobacter tilapiae]